MFFGCTLLWCGDISGGVDISDVLGCHLLWQMSSQCVIKKLLQGLVSHELTAYLSIFNLFKLSLCPLFFINFFISPNDTPLKTTKIVFYFIRKALFVLKTINFL